MGAVKKPNILIVDDDDSNLYLLQSFLKILEVNFILAQSGPEALSKIKDENIALALLDIQMTGMSGVELATLIQSDNSREIVPIIFVTGHSKGEKELEECYESGAVDFILKPVRKNILLSKVRIFLELYRQKQIILEHHLELEKSALELQESLESLKKSQEISHVGSWQMNLNTGKVSWSDEMYKIFGYERNGQDENMLDAFVSAIFPEDKKNVEKRMEATFKDGICRSMDYRIVRKDGEIRWVFAKFEPLHDIEGQVVAQHGILQDLTEQKQHEFALKESERMYRTLLNASPESILIMDMKGVITEISDITHEIFGTENKSEFVGVHFFNFVPPDELERFKEILHKTQIEGLVQNVEMFLITKNHSRFICELSTTLIQEANGEPKAYMAIVRDISLRKKIEQQLIRSGRMVSLGEMASAMAHEINQPLLSISLGIDNLFHKIEKTNVLNESYFRDKSEKIYQDVSRIGRIIDHVRTFSRDYEEFISTSFDLNDSISNAISMISEQFKNQHIRIIEKFDKKIPSVAGNTYRFEQVILNILTNAKDALDEKTKRSKLYFEKTIHVRTFQNEQMIVVELKDDGCGIEPEILDRIMLPFFTTKETGKGTGIGLSISFGIIKEMNGTFDVESHPMVGSTFRIKFPIPNIEVKRE
jgi:PAS domain S-box-containing protein